jgi:hypothetical protein
MFIKVEIEDTCLHRPCHVVGTGRLGCYLLVPMTMHIPDTKWTTIMFTCTWLDGFFKHAMHSTFRVDWSAHCRTMFTIRSWIFVHLVTTRAIQSLACLPPKSHTLGSCLTAGLDIHSSVAIAAAYWNGWMVTSALWENVWLIHCSKMKNPAPL